MKGILLAVCISIALFATVTAGQRLAPAAERIVLLPAIFAFWLIVLVAVYLSTPADLGFLPLGLQGEPGWLDLSVSIFALSASFFGGWLQVYNLASRGYSLRLLVDLLQSPRRSATPEELVSGYARGRGLTWMYQRRIDGLLATRIVQIDKGEVRLTSRGQRLAQAFHALRRIYRVGEQRP